MTPNGLIRYGSAPGSLLSTAVDSVFRADREFPTVGFQNLMGPYFNSDSRSSSLTSESACKVNSADPPDPKNPKPVSGLQRSYGLNDLAAGDFSTATNFGGGGGGASSSLVRHSSSPAGFVNYVNAENGFSITRGVESFKSQGGVSRLKSQLSFTRQDSLSHISEVSENEVEGSSSDNGRNATHSYGAATSFSMGSWDSTNSIVFSSPQSKRAKNLDGRVVHSLNGIETQYSLPQTALERATVESMIQIPQDSVPCRIRAKRGCATHPRSIAERERRTRITGKLKKIEELFPNMDKQTSYADMLDLAMEQIKGLQQEVQKLNEELEGCTCGCKKPM